MRRFLEHGLLAGALLLTAGAAQAQNNVLKVDIFRPIVNTLALSYEHKLSEASSFQLGLDFTINYREDGGFFTSYSDTRKTSGFGLKPEYRFYLSEKHPALEGFYVAPALRFQHLKQTGRYESYNPSTGSYTVRSNEATLNAFGAQVTVGRHWIFKQRFSLDLYLGPSYLVSGVSSTDPNIDKNSFLGYYEDGNYGIDGGLTFGLAF